VSDHERERLCAYLDGELPPGERTEVEAHLAACAVCTALLADLTAVDGAVRSLPAEAPDGYFETFPSRVLARLGAASRAPVRPRRLPAWTWAAAAALLLAVVAPLTLRQRAPGQVPGTTQAPGAPRPASEDQKHERDAPRTPVAAPGPAARRQPGFASPPAAARPGAAPVAESRIPAETDARNEAGFEAPPVPLPARAASGEGAASRSKREDAPAGSEVRQEAAPVTSGSLAAPESVPAPARRAPGVAAAPMASSARQDETAAGASFVPQPQGAFGRLEASRPRTAEQWRRLRDAWRAFAAAHLDDPRADEARVRAIEAGREAWLVGGTDDDEAAFLRDARAYLEREDAVQKERVERLLPPAPPH
jgi:hypothetical protein